MKNFSLIFGIIFMMTCCSKSNNSETKSDFSDEDFEIIQLSIKNTELITPGDIMLRRPYMIQVINDSILAVADSRNQSLVYLINQVSNTGRNVVERGEGPEELTELTTMIYNNGELSASGFNDGKILRFDIDCDSLNLKLSNSAKVPFQPLRSLMINDSTVFALSPNFSGHRYSVYHVDNGMTEHIDKFPLDSITLNVNPDNNFMQADVSISPDNKHIAIANRYWPIIEIIDTDGFDIRKYLGPMPVSGEIEKVENDNYYSYSQKPKCHMWDGIEIKNKSIYAGFNGYCRFPGEENNNPGVKRIYSFSIKDGPQKIYCFDSPIDAFTVDEDNNVIYTIQNNPEPSIMKYNLTR